VISVRIRSIESPKTILPSFVRKNTVEPMTRSLQVADVPSKLLPTRANGAVNGANSPNTTLGGVRRPRRAIPVFRVSSRGSNTPLDVISVLTYHLP
jgi:hypothetical protein